MVKLRTALRACALLAIAVSLSCSPSDREVREPFGPQQAVVRVGQTQYTRIEERGPDDSVLSLSQTIGILGGRVSIAGHTITVPAGAVDVPTLFTLRLAANGYVEVDVSAVLSGLLGSVIDVGSKGFKKPVALSLTYARATNVTDPERLKILRLNSNGRHELMPSVVETGPLTVTAYLDHFSAYCMVSD